MYRPCILKRDRKTADYKRPSRKGKGTNAQHCSRCSAALLEQPHAHLSDVARPQLTNCDRLQEDVAAMTASLSSPETIPSFSDTYDLSSWALFPTPDPSSVTMCSKCNRPLHSHTPVSCSWFHVVAHRSHRMQIQWKAWHEGELTILSPRISQERLREVSCLTYVAGYD